MFSPQDRWLVQNVKAEEESEKGSASSQATPSPARWSAKDQAEMDQMLAPSSPAHKVSNDNLMQIASNREYFDDEEDVSTLANDTVANETFFKNNRLSPPRNERNPNGIFDTPSAANPKRPNKFADSPNTAPETPPKEGDNAYYQDFEQGNKFSKRFWKIVIVATCLGSFLIAAVIVLGMNYYNIREERFATEDSSRGTGSSSSAQNGGNNDQFEFDIRTGTPSFYTSAAPTISPAPTITKEPSSSPTWRPTMETASPTTPSPTGLPTVAATENPTLTFSPTGGEPTIPPPTGQPTTPSPTATETDRPTASPTTAVPTQDVSPALMETIINAPHLPLETMIDLQARDESSYPYQVAQWLARDPNLESYSEEVIIQRFALGCLYKGFTMHMAGSNPMETTWMTYTDFCEWTVSSETLCDGQGLASSIIIENFDLEGEIVPEIGLLADSLTRLVITNNFIRGTLPTEMGFLTKLERIRTHNNAMVGSLPTEIGNMRNMLSLRLGRNEHTGTIPNEIGNLALLETIHMPRNQFTGRLPDVLTRMNTLTMIILKDNLLTGQIPEGFSKMKTLTDLELQHNDFTGEIKKKEFCKDIPVFIVDCAEVSCKCCTEANCCVNCDGRGF